MDAIAYHNVFYWSPLTINIIPDFDYIQQVYFSIKRRRYKSEFVGKYFHGPRKKQENTHRGILKTRSDTV